MAANPCPDQTELSDFVLGKLAAERREQVAEHLETCSNCQATIETVVDQNDSLLAGVRRLQEDEDVQYADAPGLKRALTVIEGLRHGASTSVGEKVGAADQPPQLGQVRDYQLLEKLGQGGMGTVYKALHSKLKRLVALKVLPEDRLRDPQAVARFEREMEAVGKLHDPNIVQALDAGEHDGNHYLVMEYVPGVDLSELVGRCGPLPIAEACEIIRQAALGLEHAHQRGLVHRDIKPSNLMLTPAGEVKVLDLGLALLQQQPAGLELTSTGQVMGTLDYIAPEQADDSHVVDGRADVYSLGATFYKLLCGQAMFSGPQYSTPLKKLRAVVDDPVPPITQVRSDIPAELSSLLERMLAKSPADRFATPGEVAQALAPLAKGADLAALSERLSTTETTQGNLSKTLVKGEVASRGTDQDLASAMTETRPSESKCDQPAPSDSTTAIVPEPTPARRASEGAEAPRSQTSRVPPRRKIAVATAAAVIGVIALGIVIYVNTNHGRLVIDTKADDVKVIVEGGGEVQIIDPQTDRAVKLSPGEYDIRLEEEKAGLSLSTKSFTMRRGEQVVVEVRYEPQEPPRPSTKPATPQPPSDVADLWNAEPQSEPLPGLIPAPVKLAGIRRWQIETTAPRGWCWSVTWSPDGKYITCSDGNRVRIYDAANLRPVRLLHCDQGRAVKWSSDGRRLAIAQSYYRQEIHIWNADGTPQRVLELPREHGYLTDIDWHPSGERIVAATQYGGTNDSWGRLVIWDVGSEKTELVIETPTGLFDVAWIPDGSQIASASPYEPVVRLWNAEDGTAGPVLEGHAQFVEALAWSPDGKWLASGGGEHDRTIRLWKPDGTPGPVMRGHRDGIASLAWHAESNKLASVSDWYRGDMSLRIWDVTGKSLHVFEDVPYGNGDSNQSVAWSPDGTKLVCATAGSGLRIVTPNGQLVLSLEGHGYGTAQVAWDPSGSRFASVGHVGQRQGHWPKSITNSVHLWDSKGEPLNGFQDRVKRSAIAWSPNGQQLATGCYDKQIRLWDAGGNLKHELKGHTDRVTAVAWSPDGEQFASGSVDSTVRFWKADGTAGPVVQDHNGHVLRLAWSPDGARLASGSTDRTIRLWGPDGKAGPILEADSGISELTWSAGGQWLAARTEDHRLRLWKADGTPGPIVEGFDDATLPAWSPSGTMLAWADAGKQPRNVHVWDADKYALRHFQGDNNSIDWIGWSPDGQRLFAAGERKVWLWNVRDSSERVFTVPGDRGDWSPDGSLVVHPCPAGRYGEGQDSGIAIHGRDGATGALQWIAVPLSGGRGATFEATGQLKYGEPDVVEKEFIYVVEIDDGKFELLTHADFMQRAEATVSTGQPSEEPAAAAKPEPTQLPVGEWIPLFDTPDSIAGVDWLSRRNGVLEATFDAAERGEHELMTDSLIANNMVIRAKLKVVGANGGLSLRLRDSGEGDEHYASWFKESGSTGVGRRTAPDGNWVDLQSANIPVRDDFCDYIFAAVDNKLSVFADGEPVIFIKDDRLTRGTPGITVYSYGGQVRALFKDLQVQNLDGLEIASSQELIKHLGIEPLGRPLRYNEPRILGWHEGAMDVAISHDGALAATGGEDDQIALWDLATSHEIRRLPYRGARPMFSSDDRHLLARDGKVVRLIDLDTGKPVFSCEHSADVRGSVFSPDGKRFLTSADDGTLRLWNSGNGELVRIFDKAEASLWRPEFSADGRLAASGSDDGIVRVWDVDTGNLVTSLEGHADSVMVVRFLSNQRLVSGSYDATVRVWSLESGRETLRLEGHVNKINDLHLTDRGLLLSHSQDGSLRVWSLDTGRQLTSFEVDSAGNGGFGVTSDGKHLVRADDKAIRMMRLVLPGTIARPREPVAIETPQDKLSLEPQPQDLEPGQPLNMLALVGQPAKLEGVASWTIDTNRHRSRIEDLAYRPDGKLLATAGQDGTVRVWNSETWELARILYGLDQPARTIGWSPGGNYLASFSGRDGNGTVLLWNAATGARVGNVQVDSDKVQEIAWSGDGTRLAVPAKDVVIVNPKLGLEVKRLVWPSEELSHVAWSADNRWIAAGGREHPVQVWEAATYRLVATLPERGDITSLAFSPDSRLLAVSGRGGRVLLWDLGKGRELESKTPIVHPSGSVRAVVFSPDGKELATAGGDRHIRRWDLETGEEIPEMRQHDTGITALDWSPDGVHLVSAAGDGSVTIWDLQTGKWNRRQPGSFHTDLGSVSWSRDGKMALTGKALGNQWSNVWILDPLGDRRIVFIPEGVVGQLSPEGRFVAGRHVDQRLRLLDARTGEMISPEVTGRVRGEPGSIAWSPDSRLIAAAKDVPTVRVELFDAETRELVRTFTSDVTVTLFGGLAFSPDGTKLAAVVQDSEAASFIKWWDVATGEQFNTLQGMKQWGMGNPAWSPDGSRIVANSAWGAYVFDFESGKVIKFLLHQQSATNWKFLTWHRDRRHVIGALRDQILVWDLQSDFVKNNELAPAGVISCHAGGSFAWSPDRTVLTTPVRAAGVVRFFEPLSGRLQASLTVLPEQDEQAALLISGDGHYKPLGNLTDEIVYTTLLPDGRQETMSATEFEKRFGWNNDPTQAQLVPPQVTTERPGNHQTSVE